MAEHKAESKPNNWRWIGGAVALLIVIGGGIMAWRNSGQSQLVHDVKVVVVGIDGMDPNLLEEYMATGVTPHLARLREQGLFTRLGTTIPPESPVAWSTFATGCNPGKHGLFDFVKRAPQTYLPDLAITRIEGSQYVAQRQGVPFWAVSSAHDVPSTVVRCPITFPPEEVRGRMLSGMGVPDLRGSQGTFSYWTTEAGQTNGVMGGRVTAVERQGTQIQTVVYGPATGAAADREDLTLPLQIELDLAQKQATLTLQGQTHTVAQEAWSPWFRVKFKTGFFQSISAICRFYLKSVGPEFALYGSPMNFDPEKPPYPISYPKGYAKELVEAIGLYHTQGMPEDTWALNEGRLDDDIFLELCEHIHAEREAMLWHELSRFQGGVLVTVFDTVDRVQHMFWRAIDQKHPLYTPELSARYGKVIEDWYRRADAMVGQVMDKIDDETTLVVLSDHGFSSFRRAVHINSWLRDQGWLVLNAGREEGRGYGQDIDWSRTQAYALGIGGIYLNLAGREPQGIVQPGETAKQLKQQIAERLKTFTDPKTDQGVVHRSLDREVVYTGPEAEQAPDIFVGFAEGYRASWQTAVGGVPRELMEDNLKKWSGDHIVDPELVPGILLVNRALPLDNPRLTDIAPTILKLVGAEIPASVDGKALW